MMAKTLGVDVGDGVQLEVTGVPGNFNAEVLAITTAFSPQGVFLSREAWEALGGEFVPTSVLAGASAFIGLQESGYFKEVTSVQSQTTAMDELTASVNTIVVLLIAASLLLSVVVLYNLGMLSFVEREREYATMKVMGYRKPEIRNIILRDWLATAIPGYLLGIPLGFTFLNIYIQVVAFESYEWVMRLTPLHFAVISAVVLGCSLCVSLYISHKAQKIVMTEALKSVE